MKPFKRWIGLFLPFLFVVGGLAQEGTAMSPQFADVTESVGISLPDRTGRGDKVTGQAWGDYDQDGWLDLYLTDTEGANVLYRSNGDGTFSISALTASISLPDARSGGAIFADYDNDGWPDLYVLNWGANVLYHNDNGKNFSDVTAVAGVGDEANSQTAAWEDYDEDGFLDLYVANGSCDPQCGQTGEGSRDRLYHNNGDGTFSDMTHDASDLDFYFSNAGPLTLLQNQGDGTFADAAEVAGVNFPAGNGWGAVFLDADNDGWQDLYLAVAETADGTEPANPLFHNNGDGTFTDLGQGSGAADSGASVGVAYADYDQDGWVDLVVGNFNSGYRLYRNLGGDLPLPNNWLTLKLTGGGPVNRDAVGTRVTVVDGNGRSQIQEVKSGSSLGSGSALELYFGLGTAEIANVTVLWPDGTTQELGAIAHNRRYEVAYGANHDFLPDTPEPAATPVNEAGSPSTMLAETVLRWLVFLTALVLAYQIYRYWQESR